MLTRVLVANRGEIAVRIVRACAELGIASVAVHSDPDAGALHVRLADEAVALPGRAAADTYLDADALLAAAARTGADAVHPGYGFLAEDAAFAAAVGQAGLAYVGPTADAVAAMGDKVSARALAVAAGVPVLPAAEEDDLDADRVIALGRAHGWPVVVKAARGGGGRGMRVVTGPGEVADALTAARSEARSAFGDGTVYAEKYLARPRHVEVQVLADHHCAVVWLGDRDCSVQRRHQKLVEEAPAPGLDDGLRAAMGEAAVALARKVGYRGAGTVEFLVDSGRFHFLEMNTRIQVEHPVTEAVLGVDLVREQLLIAGGAPLSVTESGPAPRGHAVECRIVAEDGNLLPAAGILRALHVPSLPGVRLDSGYEAGDTVPPDYDGLVAKLVVWGPTRGVALHRARAALAGTLVEGVPTTVPAAAAVLAHPDFVAGGVPTGWFEQELRPHLPSAPEPPEQGAWICGRFHRIPAPGPDTAAPRRAARPATERRRTGAAAGDRRVLSPMQGTVVAVDVAAGGAVTAGAVVVRVEAMKMENPVRAAVDGTVETVCVRVGQIVAAGEPLLVLAPQEPS